MKTVFNRKERRRILRKPTKFVTIARNENGLATAYIHPTKGFRGNKKAILKYKESL